MMSKRAGALLSHTHESRSSLILLSDPTHTKEVDQIHSHCRWIHDLSSLYLNKYWAIFALCPSHQKHEQTHLAILHNICYVIVYSLHNEEGV